MQRSCMYTEKEFVREIVEQAKSYLTLATTEDAQGFIQEIMDQIDTYLFLVPMEERIKFLHAADDGLVDLALEIDPNLLQNTKFLSDLCIRILELSEELMLRGKGGTTMKPCYEGLNLKDIVKYAIQRFTEKHYSLGTIASTNDIKQFAHEIKELTISYVLITMRNEHTEIWNKIYKMMNQPEQGGGSPC